MSRITCFLLALWVAGCALSDPDTTATRTTVANTLREEHDRRKTVVTLEEPLVTNHAMTWESEPVVASRLETPPAARSATPEPATGFALEAIRSGLREVELGKLAREHTTNPRVRSLAQRMVEDHARANQELRVLVGEMNLTLPEEDPNPSEIVEHLSSLDGPAFDRRFADLMVDEHEKVVTLYEREATEGLDATLRDWAAGKLIMLRHHLELARQLDALI